MATTSEWYDGRRVTVLTCAETVADLRGVLADLFPGVDFTVTAHDEDRAVYGPPGFHVSWTRGALSPNDPGEENSREQVVSSMADDRIGRKWDEGHGRTDYRLYRGDCEYGPGEYHTYDTAWAECESLEPHEKEAERRADKEAEEAADRAAQEEADREADETSDRFYEERAERFSERRTHGDDEDDA
jgi:hypothetical protein